MTHWLVNRKRTQTSSTHRQCFCCLLKQKIFAVRRLIQKHFLFLLTPTTLTWLLLQFVARVEWEKNRKAKEERMKTRICYCLRDSKIIYFCRFAFYLLFMRGASFLLFFFLSRIIFLLIFQLTVSQISTFILSFDGSANLQTFLFISRTNIASHFYKHLVLQVFVDFLKGTSSL